MPDLIGVLLNLDAEIAEMKRRFENGERPGTVHEVDAARKRCRLRIGGGDGEPFLTPWIPYVQHAGALKFHSPPSPGQQMMFVCPDGDFRQGRAEPYTWSNHNPPPSDSADEHVLTFGQAKQMIREGQMRHEVGSSIVRVAEGNVRAKASMIDLN